MAATGNGPFGPFQRSKGVGCAAALLALLATAGPLAAEPFVPATDDQVLEQAVVSGRGDRLALREMRARLERTPRDLPLALDLADRSLALGRASGDPRSLGHAEAALGPWWQEADPPVPVLVLRATIRQHGHDFDGALDDLDRATARDPRNVQAWLTKAAIHRARGEYALASASCRRLLLGRTDPLVPLACEADIASLTGRARAGYDGLLAASRARPRTDPALGSWIAGLLGEMAARLGDHGAALAHFQDALARGGRDAYLEGARTDLLLDLGRNAEVRDLLKDETAADGALLRLALAESQLGSASAAGRIAMLRDRFQANRARGTSHLRDEARFALHLAGDAEDALALALENWNVHKEPWDARLVLEAALAAGAPDRARPVAAWLEETGLEDVRIQALLDRLVPRSGT
jgi:hypothetical protein